MEATHDRNRFAGIDRDDQGWREVRGEVELAASDRTGGRRPRISFHIVDIRKASARSISSAIYWGATQMLAFFDKRTVLVSNGAS
jgi:hypothetical protein